MKEIIQTLIVFLPVSILAAGAVFLAHKGIDGWGWMLLVIVLLMGSTSMHVGGFKKDSQQQEVKVK